MSTRAATPVRVRREDGSAEEVYVLPSDEAYLHDLFAYLFHEHWREIIFGPIIEGAAFEIACPCAPRSISLNDGYLPVHFGRSHFHLCIGDNQGAADNPTPAALRARRRNARAELVRGLDRHGDPITWSLRLTNGAGEQQMTVFFPNPFLTDDDQLAPAPDWTRLRVWEQVCRRCLDLPPDPRDRQGAGFQASCG